MPRRQLAGALAVTATVSLMVFWLVESPSLSSRARLGVVIAALASHCVVVALTRRPGTITRTTIIAGIVVVFGAAVMVAPRDSNDVWGYVSYARVLSEHHQNPYLHSPSEFPDDPLIDRMSDEYRSTPTIYGPAFTAVSSVGTAVAGGSPLLNRVFFQLLSAAAAIVALVLVDRRVRGRDPTALAFLGLSPVVVAIVNGAHTDLIIGALLLGAVIVAGSRRPAASGVLLGIAALVKVVALAPAAALVVWVWRRHGHRAGLTVAGVMGALVGGAYLVVGGLAALQPVRDGRLFGTRGQAWELLRARWSDALAADGVRHAAEIAHTDIARVATPIVVLVIVLAIWRLSSDRDPAVPTIGAGLAFLLTAPYVLPWYAGWVLPMAATSWRRTVALVAQAQAALVLLAYADPPGQLPPEGPLLEFSSRYVPYVGIGLAVVFVILCAWPRRTPPATVDSGDSGSVADRPPVKSAP